jgi:hypothetical protein
MAVAAVESAQEIDQQYAVGARTAQVAEQMAP